MALQHFFLTRFNVASSGREAHIRTREGWLERRFELFERYCLPSVAAQTQRDFGWLIYFDAQTNEDFHQRIESLRSRFPFEPRFVDDFFPGIAAQDIAKRVLSNTKRLLTTRLDNDDAIAENFVSELRKVTTQTPDDTALNFPHGLSLMGGKLFREFDQKNPFVSVLECAENARTVWHDQHRNLEQYWPYRQIGEAPAWLKVIHRENVSNRSKGERAAKSTQIASFSLDPEVRVIDPSSLELLTDRMLFHPLRRAREGIIRLAKGLKKPFHTSARR